MGKVTAIAGILCTCLVMATSIAGISIGIEFYNNCSELKKKKRYEKNKEFLDYLLATVIVLGLGIVGTLAMQMRTGNVMHQGSINTF